jgi:transposase InsO family protein
LAEAPWNKIHDGVRWLAHELRRLCPEREFETKTIATHIMRAGIQISQTTVRRILAEEPPKKPRRSSGPMQPVEGGEPYHLLRPKRPNRIWHMDITVKRLLWMRLHITAIVDGFSRKLIALHVYRSTPATRDMLALAQRATKEHGQSRFLATDHGCQFGKAFEVGLGQLGIIHVRGKVRSCAMTAKVERFFWTFKRWWRIGLFALSRRKLQRQLDGFKNWYNKHRPHQALGGLTPEQAWLGDKNLDPTDVLHRGPVEPVIQVERLPVRGDPDLPEIVIDITLKMKNAA